MAKTEVKNIIVALRAKIGNFRKKMAAAKKSLGNFAKAAREKMKKVAAVTAAAGVAAAAGVGYMAKKCIDGMDATGKLADRLGMTTKSLTAMRHAADLNGVSAGALEKGLEGYVRRLGDAAKGTGPAAEAMKKFGLSVDELSRMPVADQMALIADKIKELPTPAAKAAAANALLGKSGLQMVTMLQQGGDAMRAAMREADDLGMTYDRATAAMAESVNDNLARVKGVFAGLGASLTTTLLPGLLNVSTKLAEWAKAALPKIKAAFEVAFAGISEIVSALGAVFSAVFSAVGGILEAFGLKTEGTGGLVQKIFEGIVKFVKWWAAGFIKLVTMVETAFVNWREVLTIVFKGVVLGLIKFYEDFKHFLTVAIPEYLKWFRRNWRNVFTDIWNFIKTIVTNMGKNLWGFFKAVGDWLKGKGFNFKFTGLTEGFKKTCEDLPKIAKRAKTKIEKSLEVDIANAKNKVTNYYNKKVAERLAKLNAADAEKPDAKKPPVKKPPVKKPAAPGLFDRVKKGIGNMTGRLADGIKKLATKAKGLGEKLKKQAAEAAKKSKLAKKGPTYSTSDFAVLKSRNISIAALARQVKKDRQNDIANNTKATADAVNKLARKAKGNALVFV